MACPSPYSKGNLNLSFLFLLCRSIFDLTACGLDLALGGYGNFADLDCVGFRELTVAKKLDALIVIADESRGDQRITIHCITLELFELSNVDQLVRDFEILVVETTAWKFTVEGHLTAFETDADTPTRASLLALMSLTGCLAMTTTFTSSETFRRVCGPFYGWYIFEIHVFRSLDFRNDFAETDILNFLV